MKTTIFAVLLVVFLAFGCGKPPRERFEQLYRQWLDTWSETAVTYFTENNRSLDPRESITLPAYRAIVALGRPALPLLKEKLEQDGYLDRYLAFAVIEICGWDLDEIKNAANDQDDVIRLKTLERLTQKLNPSPPPLRSSDAP